MVLGTISTSSFVIYNVDSPPDQVSDDNTSTLSTSTPLVTASLPLATTRCPQPTCTTTFRRATDIPRHYQSSFFNGVIYGFGLGGGLRMGVSWMVPAEIVSFILIFFHRVIYGLGWIGFGLSPGEFDRCSVWVTPSSNR